MNGRARPALGSIVLTAVVVMAGCGRAPRLNVLLVTFDTTRADHLPAYGFAGVATPTLDALAAEAVLFERAYSSTPMTLPAHTTILTGRFPPGHGVRDNGLFTVAPEVTTLAEILRSAGYRTAAAVGAFPLVGKFGLDQGFELFDDRLDRVHEDFRGVRQRPRGGLFFEERQAQRVNEAIYPWLEAHREEPFFLWVHYFDPHQPLAPPRPYDQLYGNDLYLGEIAYADEALGTLFAALRRDGVWDRTVVVFTADHGEGRGEHHELTHSYLLYDSTLHVPLIIRAPGEGGARRVASPVRHVDILPTVLELLGRAAPADIDGVSLVPHLQGEPVRRSPPHYAETLSPRLAHGWGELRAIIDGDWKYIHGPRPELFDLAADPREVTDRSDAEPARAASLRDTLTSVLATIAAAAPQAPQAPDVETRRRLEALGYLGSGMAANLEIREELSTEGVAPQDRVHRVSTVSRIKELMSSGQARNARPLIAELMAEDPSSPYYLELAARTEALLGNFDEAVELLHRERELTSDRAELAETLTHIAAELFRAGRDREALDLVREALEFAPTGDGFFLESLLAERLGDSGASRLALERAVAATPHHGPALVSLAIDRAREGATTEAAATFAAAVHGNPYYPKAHFNRGAFLFGQREFEEAAACFRRAAELDPDYAEAWEALGRAYASLDRPAEIERLIVTLGARGAAPPLLETLRALVADEASP